MKKVGDLLAGCVRNQRGPAPQRPLDVPRSLRGCRSNISLLHSEPFDDEHHMC